MNPSSLFPPKKRAVIYTNGHPNTLDINAIGKFDECVEYANDSYLEIVAAYSFCDFHETQSEIPAKVYQLLEAVSNGSRPFDMLVLHEWRDLSSSPCDAGWIASCFHALGVEVYFLTDESSSEDEGYLEALPDNAQWAAKQTPVHLSEKCGRALTTIS